ncbi:MAG: hypothetical protein KA270_01010 [Saprospiraceae bacterium]|nr:hypothetical protein [Saprospiraceae bacterium]MBP6565709.1 hypothetical protein [Saprospiraceae bacterium]
MTFIDFINKYDFPGSIVLLEGKRDVPNADQKSLTALGMKLAASTTFMLLRSGNAAGADHYFSEGVFQVAPDRLQVITPYTSHRNKGISSYRSIPLDNVNLMQEPEVVYQSKHNKKTANLIDKYVAGARDRFSIKAAYIIRDTVKAIGTTDIPPANFGIFYDDLTNPMQGGTGHTMDVCHKNGIPVIDQSIWFDWL